MHVVVAVILLILGRMSETGHGSRIKDLSEILDAWRKAKSGGERALIFFWYLRGLFRLGYYGATVTVVTVNDPILAETADLKVGSDWLAKQCLAELKSEVAKTFAGRVLENVDIRYEIATGAPAPEILRVARERQCDLIVMSSRGLSGVRRLFFGATTERVLRETTVPMLVTPPSAATPFTLEEMATEIRRVLVPVDLQTSPTRQVSVAAGIAAALGTPLLLLHVLEPLRVPVPVQMPLPNVDVERRAQALAIGERHRSLAEGIGPADLAAGNPGIVELPEDVGSASQMKHDSEGSASLVERGLVGWWDGGELGWFGLEQGRVGET